MFIQMYHERYMRFPEGREKALTFSYDDGVSADRKLIEIFNRYGLKGTFNLNSALFGAQCWHGRMDEAQTIAAYRDGPHEVAMHGARHVFLDKVPAALGVKELADNRARLEEKFGRIVRGMAYAYSGATEQLIPVMRALGIAYARTTVPTYSFALPQDWLHLNPTCHHADPRLGKLLAKFLNNKPSEEFKHREPWLMYIWGHSYEFEDNGNWNIAEDIGKSVCGRGDIWCATNGDIYDYVQCYNSLIYSLDGESVFNPSYRAVWVEIRGECYRIGSGQKVTFAAP